jgi:hypothetical protein
MSIFGQDTSVAPTEVAPQPIDIPELTPAAVDYTPVEMPDWKVATPADEGLDPKLVADLWCGDTACPQEVSNLLLPHSASTMIFDSSACWA